MEVESMLITCYVVVAALSEPGSKYLFGVPIGVWAR
jgi:hypothetical protein